MSDVCSQYAQVWCQQQYSCKTGTDLQAIETKYGTDVATCVKVFDRYGVLGLLGVAMSKRTKAATCNQSTMAI